MIDKEKKGRSEAGQKYAADGHPRDADAEWRRRESEMTLNREFYDRIDLDSLVNLIDLLLENNQLTGTIPSTLGKLTKLSTLYLFGIPQLIGTVPSPSHSQRCMAPC